MPERLTKARRSFNMSRVKNRDTKPEMIVRSFLHKNGFRFRLCVAELPGHPDIVLHKYKTVIQVRGCFWHRHEGCKRATTPQNNKDFWLDKFNANVARDKLADRQLRDQGWNLIVIWECQLKKHRVETLTSIITQIRERSD